MTTPGKALSFILAMTLTLCIGNAASADAPAAGINAGACPPPRLHQAPHYGHRFSMLTAQQRAQLHELLRQGRIADLKYQQEIMDQHFALARLALAAQWHEREVTEHAKRLADAIARRTTAKMKLRREIRDLLHADAEPARG